jgi:hypothetical protein
MRTLLEALEENHGKNFSRVEVQYFRLKKHKVETLFFFWHQGVGWTRPRDKEGELAEIPFYKFVIGQRQTAYTQMVEVTNIRGKETK